MTAFPLGERLRALRERRGMTRARLGGLAGLDAGAVERIETGETDPPLGHLLRLAEALETPLSDLLGLPPASIACRVEVQGARAPAGAPPWGCVPVPLVSGEAAGGNARIVDESILDWLFLPGDAFGARAGSLVAVRIHGRSMEPELPDGCIAVIDRNDRAVYREGIFALRESGGGCTVKRVEILDEGHLALIPSNRGEFQVEFWRLEPGETPRDRIIGRVVWVGFNLLEGGKAAEREPPYGTPGLGRASDLPRGRGKGGSGDSF